MANWTKMTVGKQKTMRFHKENAEKSISLVGNTFCFRLMFCRCWQYCDSKCVSSVKWCLHIFRQNKRKTITDLINIEYFLCQNTESCQSISIFVMWMVYVSIVNNEQLLSNFVWCCRRKQQQQRQECDSFRNVKTILVVIFYWTEAMSYAKWFF